jgi:hypothetical protein
MGGIILPTAINVANKGSVGPTLIHGETSGNKKNAFLPHKQMRYSVIINYSLTEIPAN